jgi:uncharacterized membrane protein
MASILSLLTGNFAGNSHPLHPATVHFPIAFLSLGYGLDVLQGAIIGGYIPSSFQAMLLEHLSDFAFGSYALNLIGIVTALPAIVTGVMEQGLLVKSQGLYQRIEKDGKVISKGMNPRAKIGMIHAGINDLVFLASVYNWYVRRSVAGFTPSTLNIGLSAAMLPSLFFSAYLGGTLVYKYGTGVQRMGKAAEIKADEAKLEVKGLEGETMVLVKKQSS